ncbi:MULTISPECIES: hypothetical protein [unclassified Brenneria]|uniref:hypothetical protein n=1 Tax=unclassified Brenneria TaxID=2634434 RepID=UPI0018F0E66A|nr:hypothetical protein [Brenneria sp. L3-3C-1]MBJ7223492.1 hypothetical protein [Brenneria sp. L3-3C-1]MEE3644732.1 hypothetical protein [Brenneria sp. L3_3C_1]
MKNIPHAGAMLLAAIMASSVLAAEHDAAGPPETAEFAGQPLALVETSGQCAVRSQDGQQLVTQLDWPCRFHRKPDGQLRVEVIRGIPVALLERSRPAPSPDFPGDCLTSFQAIRLLQGQLELSLASEAAACLPSRWDEKIFIGLFPDQHAAH